MGGTDGLPFPVSGLRFALEKYCPAENCYLYDEAGNRYVDLESGVWCTSIGHGHPEILRVLQEQAGKIAHTGFSYSNKIVTEAARAVLGRHGFDGGRRVAR